MGIKGLSALTDQTIVCYYGGCEADMTEMACPYNKGYCIDHCNCPEHF